MGRLDFSGFLLSQLSHCTISLVPDSPFGPFHAGIFFFHPRKMGEKKKPIQVKPPASHTHGIVGCLGRRKPGICPGSRVIGFTLLPVPGPRSGARRCSVKGETTKTPLSLPRFTDEKTETQRGSRTQRVHGRAGARTRWPVGQRVAPVLFGGLSPGVPPHSSLGPGGPGVGSPLPRA